MATYDTFISKDFEDVQEDEEMLTVIRDLSPGRAKYRSTYAKIKISKDPKKYPDTLWVRLGRGQLIETPCSMQIMDFVDVIPKGM